MLDTPCSEVVWRVLSTQSIRQFPLHFPFLALPCAITLQLDPTNFRRKFPYSGAKQLSGQKERPWDQPHKHHCISAQHILKLASTTTGVTGSFCPLRLSLSLSLSLSFCFHSNVVMSSQSTRQEKQEAQEDKERYITLNKSGWTEKGEEWRNRRLIKITAANICTANVPGSNIIMRTPLRLEDILGRRNIWWFFATVGSHYTMVVNLIN